MTYCVGLKLNRGLVFMSDTRTNSGVDNISTFRKMFHFDVAGERWKSGPRNPARAIPASISVNRCSRSRPWWARP